MRNARLEILRRLFGENILIQARHSGVEFLDNATQVANQRPAFTSEIVDTGLTRAIEVSIWLQEFCRRAGWHSDTDEAISQQTRTPNREFTAIRNFNVIVNLQRNGNAVAFADQTRPA